MAAGEYQAQQGPLNLNLETYSRREDVLGQLTTAYMVRALSSLGIFTRSGESHTIDSLLAQGRIAAGYAGLLARWMEKLAAEGYLACFRAEAGAAGKDTRGMIRLPWLAA